MARLSLRLTAPNQATEAAPVDLGEGGGWIGRAPDNEVAIDDPTRVVSSRHARIDWDGAGFGLTDQSMNGTDLNGRRMTRAERVPLQAGDEIRIGPYRLTIEEKAEALGGAPVRGVARFSDGVPDDFTPTSRVSVGRVSAGPAPSSGVREPLGPAMPSFGTERPSFGAASAAPVPDGAGGGKFTLSLDDLIGPDEPPRALPSFGGPADAVEVPRSEPVAAAVPAARAEPVVAMPVVPSVAQPGLPEEEPVHWLGDANAPGADPAVLLSAFWRGLGIGAPHAPTPAMMEEIGLALHEALVGVAAIPGADGRDNPLANGVRDIRQHLGAPQPRLAEHVRAAFAAGTARVAAIHGCVHEAAAGLAETLSARSLEQRLGQAVRTRMPVFRRAELWRQYRALEREIRDAALHRFHQDLSQRLTGADRRALAAPDEPGSAAP